MNVFWLELKNTWKSTLKWTIALCAITFLMLAFFPSMQTEGMKELAGAKLEGIDPMLLEALGLSEMADFTVITNYFGYLLQFTSLAIMVFVMQLAVNSLVKEETDGTIEFLYSKPITRSRIYVQKTLATALSFFLLNVELYIFTVAGYVSFSEYSFAKSIEELGRLYGAVMFAGFVFMALGMLFSSLIKGSKGSSGIVMAVVFGTYILGIMGVIVSELGFLSEISPMEWIKARKVLTNGISVKEWIIGLSVIASSFLAAHEIYKKRDLG